MPQIAPPASTKRVQEEIQRFIRIAQERSEYDYDRRRRTQRRYHRSWPLLVYVPGATGELDVSAALHNASPLGIAFLTPVTIQANAVVFIKLFWHDPESIRVPALVRHTTPTEHGYLVGCEFSQDDDTMCEMAMSRGRSWYD